MCFAGKNTHIFLEIPECTMSITFLMEVFPYYGISECHEKSSISAVSRLKFCSVLAVSCHNCCSVPGVSCHKFPPRLSLYNMVFCLRTIQSGLLQPPPDGPHTTWPGRCGPAAQPTDPPWSRGAIDANPTIRGGLGDTRLHYSRHLPGPRFHLPTRC